MVRAPGDVAKELATLRRVRWYHKGLIVGQEKRARTDCVKTHWQALDQTPRLVRGVCFCAEKGFSAHQLHHLLGTQDG
ncbi:hypothetical protein, partial [Pseudomonas mosselii]|uniref:hypothetical protein n=1 Tax=Pseudomonas mosselii TaxID=78327 RepID=UPI001C7148CB